MLHPTRRSLPRFAPALALTAAVVAAFPALAEQQTIQAFAAWEGRGIVYETGSNSGTFVGSIDGNLFVDTEKGPTSAGFMVCPTMLEIDLIDATQRGQGKCTITDTDGAKVFAEWTCQGVHLVGCDGEFKLTGGTGRMQGIMGAGALTVRSTARVTATGATQDGSFAEIGSGILLLDDLVYSLPQQ